MCTTPLLLPRPPPKLHNLGGGPCLLEFQFDAREFQFEAREFQFEAREFQLNVARSQVIVFHDRNNSFLRRPYYGARPTLAYLEKLPTLNFTLLLCTELTYLQVYHTPN